MFFEIKNIGKIKQADIELVNGITVLAGANNTGKSMFGKVLFCVLDSFRDAKKWIQHERYVSYNSYPELTDEQIQKRRITYRFRDYRTPIVDVNAQGKLREILLAIRGNRIKVVLDGDRCVDFSSDLEFQHNVFYVVCHPLFRGFVEEKSVIDTKAKDILHLIDSVVGGDLERVDGAVYFRENGSQKLLNVSYLSEGLYLFLAIKGLLEYRNVQEQDVLIFKKPETCSHPEWQIILGEVIVLLQQAFNLTILLTTHSPYFLNAIETFSNKYKVVNKYYNVTNEDGFSHVQDVTAYTEDIYDHFTKPLQTLENIRYSL